MDRPLVSLKVMRCSRPTLASAWHPFFSSSPSFSAHSTASILSLQGNDPLPGHPKTLRDLTSTTQLLTLPSSFGAIQLGETFSSCLCINNEANVEIEAVSLTVEIQTVTSKVLLAEFGGADCRLASGDNLENVVHHEIKELGQHVLACTVSYKLPPGAIPVPQSTEEGVDPSIQKFRKFYKFAVTNPLSVKTKVHVSRSPSATMSFPDRDKVFLEVHIQNLTQAAIWFEGMRFECVDGWQVEDGNLCQDNQSIFSGPNALMEPQECRQYIYVLLPTTVRPEPVNHAPGTVVQLGRIELLWRSANGEFGRLLTSMLSRKIPAAPVQTPASALPPYLKKGPVPPRPRSPHSRPSSPRPSSPFQNRPLSSNSGRPQSPHTSTMASTLVTNSFQDVEVNLLVTEIPRATIKVEKPFQIRLTLTLSGPIRSVTLVIQHVVKTLEPALGGIDPVLSPRMGSPGFSTPSPTTTTGFNYALAHQKLLVASEQQSLEKRISLPSPFVETDGTSSGVSFCGSSCLFLPPVELVSVPNDPSKGRASHDFKLTYMAFRRGFSTIGGLRILALDNEDEIPIARIIKQYDIVGEVWVT